MDDVADLVPEHAGELRLIPQLVVETARDEDLPAGQREGVDGLGIREKMKLEVPGVGARGGVALRDDALADLLDHPRLRIARVHFAPHLARHLGRRLEAEDLFLIDREGHVLLLARDRVDLGAAHVRDDPDHGDHERDHQPTAAAIA